MPVKIKTEKNYLLTEVNIDLPVDMKELEREIKAMNSTAKVVALYNQGGTLGINVEQRTKVPASAVEKIREILRLATVEFEEATPKKTKKLSNV